MICGKEATAMMLWPGKDPMPVCADHHAWAIKIAGVMGFYLGTLEPEFGAHCSQNVTDRIPAHDVPDDAA